MKKYINYIIIFILALSYMMIFKYSFIVKASILASMTLWATTIVPSLFPTYIILDLLLNYGILEIFYKIFKNNLVILVLISFFAGTPSNAKYICEFYKQGYISKSSANFLLMFSYSPNPLFVLAFSKTFANGLIVLLMIYFTNLTIFLLFRPRFNLSSNVIKSRPTLSFIDCLSTSIANSVKILILILGIVVVYGLITTLLNILSIDSIFLSSILELTNAVHIIASRNFSLLWMTFACLFGGLSIHTQVKSILEKSELSYRHFLIGRLLASIPVLAIIFLSYLF